MDFTGWFSKIAPLYYNKGANFTDPPCIITQERWAMGMVHVQVYLDGSSCLISVVSSIDRRNKATFAKRIFKEVKK